MPLDPGGTASLSLGASVGVVEGTASELAFSYPLGRKFKLSELTWDIKDVLMGGVQGTLGLGRRVRLNLGAWFAFTEGNGMMVDRDWNYPDSVSAVLLPNGRNWSDESRHPDTSLDEGIVLDQNLNVTALKLGAFSLHGLVGFKYDSWKWSSRGGTFIYSTEFYGSRDATGAFPAGQPVITYKQQYSIAYIGVGASWSRPAFQLETHLVYSGWVFARDSDFHVLRDVRFEGDFSGGTYIGLGLKAAWAFTQHWSAALGVEYQTIPEITGDVEISGSEGRGVIRDGGGLAMNALSLALEAGYRF
jgi:outer membrane protease